MLERVLKGGRQYWTLVGILTFISLVGVLAFSKQFNEGLTTTGLSRDVPWGFYIAQLTFLVGVAASAVMVVLPYYLHDYKAFGKLTILGEFLAIPAVFMCMLFVMVDLGQPMRAMNIMIHPSPSSMLFWDMIALSGYLVLNVVISMVTFGAERKGVAPPKWIRPIIILSIPWAVSIHTVTAFLYSGLEARAFWMTAILAPRFLASAFASGPSLLIILCLVVRRYTKFDPGKEAIQALAKIVTYAMAINLFFVGVELFTGLYSDIPEHVHHFQYLFFGLDGKTALVPWMWTSQFLSIAALLLLLQPKVRRNESLLFGICCAVVVAVWIEKGLGMVITGFIPNPLGHVTEYWPTLNEGLITLGIYGIGFLVLAGLYKIAISVREEIELQ
jgi:molybdopterin-containing oxidoreductase family membrane subunit